MLSRHARNAGALVVARRLTGGPSMRFTQDSSGITTRTRYQPETVRGILREVDPTKGTVTLIPAHNRWLKSTRVHHIVPVLHDGVRIDSVRLYTRT